MRVLARGGPLAPALPTETPLLGPHTLRPRPPQRRLPLWGAPRAWPTPTRAPPTPLQSTDPFLRSGAGWGGLSPSHLAVSRPARGPLLGSGSWGSCEVHGQLRARACGPSGDRGLRHLVPEGWPEAASPRDGRSPQVPTLPGGMGAPSLCDGAVGELGTSSSPGRGSPDREAGARRLPRPPLITPRQQRTVPSSQASRSPAPGPCALALRRIPPPHPSASCSAPLGENNRPLTSRCWLRPCVFPALPLIQLIFCPPPGLMTATPLCRRS